MFGTCKYIRAIALSPLPLVAVVVLSALSPATAPAVPGHSLPDSFFEAEPRAEFNLRGSNGYSIDVLAIGSRVSFAASGRRGGASYEVPQDGVTPDRIEARFGDLGTVAVEFQASRTIREEPPRGCRGAAVVTRFGVFVGMIEFTGERGYTKVTATQAKGHTEVTEVVPGRECKSQWSEPVSLSRRPRMEEMTLLYAEAKGKRGGDVYFQAERTPRSGQSNQTIFLAGLEEWQGNMRIRRSGFAPARLGAFDFDDELATATADPPRPFVGTGTYRRGRQGNPRWTGSLAVTVPGADGRITLTGSRFRAWLISVPRPVTPSA